MLEFLVVRPPALKSLKLQGFLSFGMDGGEIRLEPLNVLIGPNGSGKSNFVEALSVLRAVPKDLPLPIREGGSVKDWLWAGEKGRVAKARLEVVLAEGWVTKPGKQDSAVRYWLEFGAQGDSFTVLAERIENELPLPEKLKPYSYFGYENGRPMLNVGDRNRELERADIDPTQSILSQRRDPENYPELTRLADLLRRVLIYRSWTFGPQSAVRKASPLGRADYLSEDFGNLPGRLSVLMGTPAVKRRLIELLGELAPGFDDLAVVPEGGALQLYLTEHGHNIPARRLSDGTLRYLCLLAILLDPEPPPLLVIEEPELGLHPDILPILRDLMVEASQRTQLVVTTHSTQFVDAMTDYADSVLICEKRDGATLLSRLTQEEVDRWREHGGLGHLWMSGHFGGTRW